MNIVCIKEKAPENRVAITPDSVSKLIKHGFSCAIQSKAGEKARFHDEEYVNAGANIEKTAAKALSSADVLVKVNPPTESEIKQLKAGSFVISHFYPASNEELMQFACEQKVNLLAMDMVPRISRAQKMDALSSMANIAGYRAVIEAGNHFGRFFTGQITAAGRIPPANILVIGAGVAGLAAIGTAASLGAVVHAFDVRPEVAEQIESMGGRFLKLDFSEDGSTSSGYAAPSSPEFRAKQLELFNSIAADMDIVITTALIPNREAPKLWLKEMVDKMKPGSVVIDLAAERGGNCDLTEKDKIIQSENMVTVVGITDFPSKLATQSSMLYSTNARHLIEELCPNKDGNFVHNMEDDVIRSVTVTKDGDITYPPPAPKVAANVKPAKKTTAIDPAELEQQKIAQKIAKEKKLGLIQLMLLGAGGILTLALGQVAPADFMQHFIVFVLSCFVGYQVIWNVSHALHTPLMAVTNAISGIIVIGALLQLNSGNALVTFLAAFSVLIATINIVGGFYVTRRMLKMFQKSG